MVNLKVDLHYDRERTREQKDSVVEAGKPFSHEIQLYKNKSSDKNFIFLEDIGRGKANLITPQGQIKPLEISLFEEQEGKEEDYLLKHGLITPLQLECYHGFVEEKTKRTQSTRPKYADDISQPKPHGKRELGPKGYEKLKDYLLPVIKLMNTGYEHTAAFKKVSEKLDVRKNTVQAECTKGMQMDTPTFRSLVKSGEIVKVLRNTFPDRIELIERELGS